MFNWIKKKFGYTDDEWRWILYDVGNSLFVLMVMTTMFAFILGEQLKGEEISLPGVNNENNITYFTALSNLIYSIIIAFSAPILGTMSDYIGFKKKFFIFFLTVGIIGTVGLMFGINYIFVIVSFIVAMIGFAGANIFYDGMLPEVTDESNYHKISSAGFAWGYIGSVVPFIIFAAPFFLVELKMINFITKLESIGIGLFLCIIWWVSFSVPLIKNVKCKKGILREDKIIGKSFKRMILTVKDMFVNNKNILIFLIAYSFYIDVVNSIITLAVSIATDLGLSATLSLILIIVVQFIAFPSALVYGALTKRYGAKKMIFVGIFVYSIIMALVGLLMTKDSIYLIWIVGVLVGLVQGGIQGVSRSMFGSLIIDEKKSGEYFGFFNVFGKFATITGPLAIVIGINFMSGQPSAAQSILFLIPSLVIGTVLMIFVKENKK